MDEHTIKSNLLTGIPLLNFMENSNAAMGIKCNKSSFVYMNQASKDFHNVPNNFDYEGRYDEDFPCPWSELAAEYKAHDRKAETMKSGAEIISTSYYTRNSVLEPWYCIKFPIYGDDGNASGTIFFARKFTFISIFDFFKNLKPSVITFNPPVDIFTERELEIIFYAISKNLR